MAIARKPQTAPAPAVDIDALIHRGGEPANGNGRNGHGKSKPKTATSGTTAVILRVPDAMLNAIDAGLATRAVRTPRHTWLLEAIHEKLEREGR